MNLSQYLTEGILSKKTGQYSGSTTEFTKEDLKRGNLIKWLDDNGFIETGIEYRKETLDSNEKWFWMFKRGGYYGISIHSNRLYELTVWYRKNGDIDEIEVLYNDHSGGRITDTIAVEYLNNAVK